MLTNALILPDIKFLRARLTVILCVLTFLGCRSETPSAPICRISAESTLTEPSTDVAAAACLIRLDDTVVMLRHRLSGKLDFPAGGKHDEESFRCAAHRETWEETGFNIEVGELLTYSSSGMPIFNCVGEPSMAALPDEVDAPPWSQLEVSTLVRIKPFDINDKALRFSDDIIPLRDAFVAAGATRKSSVPDNN